VKRLVAFFSGMVQGVGFRYTTEKVARRFDITGYVQNLPDGKVEVVAEGEEQVLKEFLAGIQDSHLKHFIRNLETEWNEAQGTYTRFEIKA
jgi:acylphosphatase